MKLAICMRNRFLIPLNFMKCFMKGALELSARGIKESISPLALDLLCEGWLLGINSPTLPAWSHLRAEQLSANFPQRGIKKS